LKNCHFISPILFQRFYFTDFISEEFEAQAEARKKAFSNVNPMHTERKTEMGQRPREVPTVRYEDVSTVV
jgi:hypothetical protein